MKTQELNRSNSFHPLYSTEPAKSLGKNFITNLIAVENRISRIDARLYQIDPNLAGQKKTFLLIKNLFRRILHREEIGDLLRLKAINQKVEKFYLAQISPSQIESRSAKSPKNQILDFVNELPILKNNPHLSQMLKERLQLPSDIQIVQLDQDTLEIVSSKGKASLDLDQPVSKEDCKRIDPSNPMLETDDPMTVKDLKRIGTIDPTWLDWLKSKKVTFSSPVIIQRKENRLHFLKGAPLSVAIEVREDSVSGKALWIERSKNWAAEDCITLLLNCKFFE